MRIPQCEVEQLISKDDIEPYRHYVYFDRDKKLLVVTNGHAMAIIPAEDVNESDTSGFITEEAIKAARKQKGGPQGMVKLNDVIEIIDGPTFPRPKESAVGKFVDWERVVPKETSGRTISLDAELLYKLARALTDKGEDCYITIHLPFGNLDAMLVEPWDNGSGRRGIIMPLQGAAQILFERKKGS